MSADVLNVTQQVLTAAGLVAEGRVKKPGDWQNVSRPWIRHQPIASGPARTHDGLSSLIEWHVQVDVFHDQAADVVVLAESVVTALEGIHSNITFFWVAPWSLLYEEETKIHRVILTFSAWSA